LDTSSLLSEHLDKLRELARRESDLLADIVFAGGSVPQLYSLIRPSRSCPRPTVDIDLAVPDPELGREVRARNPSLPLDILCSDSLNDGRPGVSFLPSVEIAFHDYMEIELEPGLVAKAAGQVAFFVMKVSRAARQEFKRGSDLYDLLVVLEQFGADQLADRFNAVKHRPEVAQCVKAMFALLADGSARGYDALFRDMNLPSTQEPWIVARFDQFLYELRKAGLANDKR